MTDTLPAISLGLDPGNDDVMEENPRPVSESFFAKGAGIRAIIAGSLIGIFTLLAFVIGLIEKDVTTISAMRSASNEALLHARTMSFIVLTVSQLFYAYTMRVDNMSTFKIGIFKNKYLNISVIIGIVLQISLINISGIAKIFSVQSLSITDWDIVIIFALIPFLINELIKTFIKFEK